MRFGDHIEYFIPGHGTAPGKGFVIGWPHYSADKQIVMLADENSFGMPINVRHCKTISSGHVEDCARWRDRFAAKHPEFLASE